MSYSPDTREQLLLWLKNHYPTSSVGLCLLLEHGLEKDYGYEQVGDGFLVLPEEAIKDDAALDETMRAMVEMYGPVDIKSLNVSYERTKLDIEKWPITHLSVLFQWRMTAKYKPEFISPWTDAHEQWYRYIRNYTVADSKKSTTQIELIPVNKESK